jgi:hypothetical protein
MMWQAAIQAIVVFGIIRLSDWVIGRKGECKRGDFDIQYGLFHRVSVT